jgi:hypothetical protein
MQTITLQVEDSFFSQFLKMIEKYQDKVAIKKDKNLELDSYFYDRQKLLQQDIHDIDSGKTTMISSDDFWLEIDNFTQSLQK